MIIRIVKMTFKEAFVNDFLEVFNKNKMQIRNFEGVKKLELLRDKDFNNIFFTYSVWENNDSLENYRKSQLFKEVWSITKVLFKDKAEAWSLHKEISL